MELPIDLYRLGRDLRSFRLTMKQPQKVPANLFGLSVSYLSSVEHGYEPALETAYRIRKALIAKYGIESIKRHFSKSLFLTWQEPSDRITDENLQRSLKTMIQQHVSDLDTNTMEVIIKLIESDIRKLGKLE